MILRAADRVAVPWKNGGGLTREVAVHPPGSDLGNFDWRVSLAEVRRAGPFSRFPEVDRHMAVLSGRVDLSMAGRERLTLSPDSPPLTFPGDLPAFAEPVRSPVTDLNVMTRRGRFVACLTRRSVAGTVTVRPDADTTLFLALAPLTLRGPGGAASLAALDAARFSVEPQDPVAVSIEGADLDFWIVELRAA